MALLNFSIKHPLAQATASSNLAKLFFTTDTNDVVIAGKNLTNNKGKEATIVQEMQSVVPAHCTDGVATIKSIKGNTVVWNQFADGMSVYGSNASISNKTTNGFTLTAPASSVDKNATQQNVFKNKDHIYYYGFDYTSTLAFSIQDMNEGGISKPAAASFSHFSKIGKATGGGYTPLYWYIYTTTSQTWTLVVKNYIVADLTLIYGADNEPETTEEFEADYERWFGKPLTYEPYDVGSFRNVQMSGIKSVGFNLWDEEWESGRLDTTTGALVSDNRSIRSKNFIKVSPSTDYYAAVPSTISFNNLNWFFFDKDYNYISFTASAQGVKQTPSNCAYIKFYTDAVYGTTYNNDICINLSDPSKNGTYEPHWDSLTEFDVTKISGIPSGGTEANREIIFPYGLQGIGDIRDVLSVANGVFSAVKKYIVVNLGSLTWTKIGNVRFYSSDLANIVKAQIDNEIPNLLVNNYTTVKFGDVYYERIDKSCSLVYLASPAHGNITIVDFSHENSDATTFKAAMDGVYAVIELETPVTYNDLKYNVSETSTPEWVSLPSLLFPVEEGGVISVVPDNSTTIETCAPKMDIRYRVLPSDIFPFLNSRADKLLLAELQSMLGSKVEGAASSVSDRIAVFDGTTGKLIKDGGKTIDNITPTQIAITHSLQTDALAVTSVTNMHDVKVVHATLLQNTIVALNVSEGYDDEPCILSGVFVPGNALISVMSSQYTVTLTDGIPYILEVQIPEWDPASDPFDNATILIKALDGTIMYTSEP